MALTRPILDNRTYEQLKDELVKRIPVYNPEWTDYNESDPGITLIELFAYLGESLLYRFNQIPETTRVEFLRLLGVQPRPAQSAHALVAASTDEPRGVQILQGSEVMSGSIPFQTDDETYVWPLEAVGAGKTREKSGASLDERQQNALTRAGLSKDSAVFYSTTLVGQDPTAVPPQVVDVAKQVDKALWIALLSKPTTDLAELGGRIVFVGVELDEQITPEPLLERIAKPGGEGAFVADTLVADPPPMLWRMWRGADPSATTPWVSLRVVGDTTGGLLRSGVVKLELPAQLPRLTSGADGGEDSPPPLTDDEMARRVVGWMQVSRPRTTTFPDQIHRVSWVGLNAVGVVQSRTAAPELIGSGTGDSDQRYSLNQRPVISGSVVLQVEEPTGWARWDEVENFVDSTSDDRHYMLDRDAGAIVFGRRRVPQLGERIRALSYLYGGGSAGNVRAATLTNLTSASGVKVTNPLPARGGADAVRLDEALDAIPGEVQRHDRAVVAEDFQALAGQVSGVARAEAMPLFHPDAPTVDAAGVVSVMVFPGDDPVNPGAPMPDLGLLRRVASYLDTRRLVTTELYVIPPEYVPLTVSVGVQIRPGYQVDAIRRWIEQIVRQYLGALAPAGPLGTGWPLGRTVRKAELEAVVVQVEGVEYVQNLRLGLAADEVAVRRVELRPWQLPSVANVAVAVGRPLALSAAGPAPAPPKRVPVPLPPDVC